MNVIENIHSNLQGNLLTLTKKQMHHKLTMIKALTAPEKPPDLTTPEGRLMQAIREAEKDKGIEETERPNTIFIQDGERKILLRCKIGSEVYGMSEEMVKESLENFRRMIPLPDEDKRSWWSKLLTSY